MREWTQTPANRRRTAPAERAPGAMPQNGEMPILVTGMPRSGTTWMQWFLSRHPRIHVHGQPPNLPWRAFWDWHQTMMRRGAWSVKANQQHGYEIAHYAGSDPVRSEAVFKRMFRDWLTGHGPEKPRWGVKWLRACADEPMVEQFESLWPETRWVVCMRDPFVSLSSQKNTFVPGQDVQEYVVGWVRTCEFLDAHDAHRVVAVQLDRLERQSEDERCAAMRRVLACVSEAPSDATDAFVRQWPRVHKVVPDEKREFVLSEDRKQELLKEVPKLRFSMEAMGYLPKGYGEPING